MGYKRNKNWHIEKVSKNLPIFDLLEEWKKILVKEGKLRKNAFDSFENFKEWYFIYLKGVQLNDKVCVITGEFKNIAQKTDEQKDWLAEKARINNTCIEPLDSSLPNVFKLIAKNENKIKEYIKHKELLKYKAKIEIEFLEKTKHLIDEKDMKAASAAAGIGPILNLYEALEGDTTPDAVYDSNGKRFTKGTWNDLLTHADKEVRRQTFASKYTTLRNHRGMLSGFMYYLAYRMNQRAKFHKYASEVEWKSISYYRLPVKSYWYIIDQCEKFAKINIKFNTFHHKLIAQAFNLGQFDPWDDCLTIDNVWEEMSVSQAEKIVAESLTCLGEEYVKNVNDLIDKKITKWDNNNKNNGACLSVISTIDENPIQVDWNGTAYGAVTFSHELGHNLKAKYTKAHNEVNNSVDKVNAEIASIVNQFITLFYLIDKYKKENNPNYVYGAYIGLLDYFFFNVCDIGSDLQFRDSFVHHYLKGAEINPKFIEQLYMDEKKRYYGYSSSEYNRILKANDDAWNIRLNAYSSYINLCKDSKFNFLSYYIGCIVGLVVSYKIYHGDKDMLNKYIKYLKAGNNKDPLHGIKLLGINILKPQIYTEAKQLIDSILKNFMKDIKVS